MAPVTRIVVPITRSKYSDQTANFYRAEFVSMYDHDTAAGLLTFEEGAAFGMRLREHPNVVMTYGYQPMKIVHSKTSTYSPVDRRTIRMESGSASLRHVVVHEVSHQVTDWCLNAGLPPHSQLFVGTFLDLMEFTYGEEVHQRLVDSFVKYDVGFHRMRNTPGRLA